MITKTAIKDLFRSPDQYAGKTVTVAGWVRTLRDQKQYGFISLNDGSFFSPLQVVFERDRIADYDDVARIGNGSAIIVEGMVALTPGARQPIELKADKITVEGHCPPEYPLQPKQHSPEFLRTIAHLRPRTNLYSAVFRIRSVVAYAIHRFFQEQGFVYVHTPIITGSDAEGAGQMFAVTTLDLKKPPQTDTGEIDFSKDFFGHQTNLTVSGQLNAEAYALAFSNVYTFGPTFRAENSNTARHAAEFWMIEPEMAFADLSDNRRVAEAMIKFLIRTVLDTCPEEMQFFNQYVDKGLMDRLTHVASSEFGVMTYTDAITELEKVKERFAYPVEWGSDLQTEHERYITEQLFKKPVFVIDYPKKIKAFYMKQNPDGRTVAAMDCLVPDIGEIIGGSQREENYERLLARIIELGMKEEDYWWYLELRRFGSVRHAGFGLGFERIIMYLTGVSNIRDVIPFPRTTGSAEF